MKKSHLGSGLGRCIDLSFNCRSKIGELERKLEETKNKYDLAIKDHNSYVEEITNRISRYHTELDKLSSVAQQYFMIANLQKSVVEYYTNKATEKKRLLMTVSGIDSIVALVQVERIKVFFSLRFKLG